MCQEMTRHLEQKQKSHKVIITQAIILIRSRLDLILARGDKRDLRLSGLALLAALVSRALLLHLLIAHRRQRASDLLDIPTGQILQKPLHKVLSPHGVIRFLRVHGQEREEGIRKLGELVLRSGLEERHSGEVDSIRGVRRVSDNDSLLSAAVPGTVDIDITKEVLSVFKIRLFLRTTKTFTFVGLILVRTIIFLVFLLGLLPSQGFVLFYPLRLALLVRRGFGVRFGFRLGCFGLFFPFYFRVFGGIPGVEDLG